VGRQAPRVEHVRRPEPVDPEQLEMPRPCRRSRRGPQVGLVHPELARPVVADQPDALQAVGGADRRAQEDRHAPVRLRRDPLQAVELARRLDRDCPDVGRDRVAQLGVALAGTRDDDSIRVDPRPDRGGELPARGDVRAEPEAAEVGHDRECRVRLDRVGDLDARRQGRPEGVDLALDHVEVVDVERGAESRREVSRVEPAQPVAAQDLVAGRRPATRGGARARQGAGR